MGESMAAVIFQLIRWAPPVSFKQDIGDDFITFARDTTAPEANADAYDLAAPVLIQVKSSARAYLNPRNRAGGKPGWWFAESATDHFDHWLSFGLPYLLVLVDTKNRIAYWAEVCGPAIKSTGKGRKIFVPASQTVDNSNLEALNAVAVARRRNDLEGIVWGGKFADLPQADRLRHALVIPRLVAPHGNNSPSTVTYEQAAAMLMQNRLSELLYLSSERGACPKPAEWSTSNDWGWRFVGALSELLTTGASEHFHQLAKDARYGFERDMCVITQACIAHVGGQTQFAEALLKPCRNTKPADRGWMRAQLAALLLELDRPDEASKAAQEALFALKSLEGDLTVSAIRGGAAAVLYSVAGIGRGDLAKTISAQDNAGAWWRAQDVSWALSKELELRFQAWAGDTSTHLMSTTPIGELKTAAWNAAFGGAWGSWRHLSTQVVELTLTSTRDPKEIANGLLLLVFVGEKAHAKAAAEKIWDDGPVTALSEVVEILSTNRWSGRAEGPTMAVFAAAGDLLTSAAADSVIERSLDTLRTQGGIRCFGGGWTSRWNELDVTLPRVLTTASIRAHEACAELVIEQFGGSEPIAHSLVRIAHGLRLAALPQKTIAKLVAAATTRNDHYGINLLELLGPVSDEAIAELRRRAKGLASQQAFRSLLVAGSRERSDYLALGRGAARTVKHILINALGNGGTSSYATYQNDQLYDLAVSALHTADNRLWKALTDALEAGVIAEGQLQSAVQLLARQFPNLPPHVQRRLRKLAPNLKGSKLWFELKQPHFESATTMLNIASGNVPDNEIEATLLELRHRDAIGFLSTLQLQNGAHKFPFLAAMAVDMDWQIRSHAAYSLIEHAHRFPADGEQTATVLRTALALNEGCAMADAVAQALNAFPSPVFGQLTDAMRHHPSAVVRSRFQAP